MSVNKPTYEELETRIRELERLVSERNNSERASSDERRRLRTFLDSIPLPVYLIDRNYRIVFANEYFRGFYGDIESKPCHQAINDKSAPCEGCLTFRTFDTGKPQQWEWRAPDGRYRMVYDNPIVEPDGALLVLEIQVDITDRKQAEQALAESEDKFRSLFDTMEEGVVLHELVFDDSGRAVDYVILDVNPAFESITGMAREQVAGVAASSLYGTGEPPYLDIYAEVVRTGKAASFETYFSPMDKHLSISAFSPGEDRFATVFFDITLHKKHEEEQARAARLESVGLLAGGIAHDFNNILTAIVGNISLAKMLGGREVEKSAEMLGVAESAAMRAKDLTRQLLTFARGGEPVKKTVALPGLIREAAGFALRGSNVKLALDIAADLRSCEVDEGQISQVLHNLLINSDQAMPGGGAVEVHAHNFTVDHSRALPLSPGDYVKITVADQGIGIPEAHMTKIFDPYFTTKQKGSGLGLATSYSIIKKHGGFIDVESGQNAGTVFTIYLPASEKRGETKQPVAQTVSVDGGRVLVMDDEPELRRIVTRMLEFLGMEVECADDGERALELYRLAMDNGRPFDAVLLDYTIPGGMGGRETFSRLRGIDPGVKAIISSGYSNDPLFDDPAGHGFHGCLSKPYRVEELREVLESIQAQSAD